LAGTTCCTPPSRTTLARALGRRRARNPDLRVVRAAQRRLDVSPGSLGQRLWALRRTDGVIVHSAKYQDALVG